MFFYVVSRTYAEIFSLLRICSGLLSNSPGLHRTAACGICDADALNSTTANKPSIIMFCVLYTVQ